MQTKINKLYCLKGHCNWVKKESFIGRMVKKYQNSDLVREKLDVQK